MWFNTFTKVLYYFTKREYCYYGCIGENRRITQTKRLDDVQIGQRSGTYAVHTDKYVHTGNKSVDKYTIGNLRGTRCEHVEFFNDAPEQSDEETHLLATYRKLTAEQKQAVQTIVEGLAK